MRKFIFAGMGISLLAFMAWAGDPWKDKPFEQWTEKDVLAVLQLSPWAKANLAPGGAWHPADQQAMTSPISGMAGSSSDNTKVAAGSLPGQAGGAEKNAKAGPTTYNVYWWSSRTIRAAFVRYAILKGRAKPEGAQKMVDQPFDDYQLYVQSNNMSVFEQRGENFFQNAAYLQMKKSKEKVTPSQVVFNLGPDGKTVSGVYFHFPKKDKHGELTIGPDEKEVDFYLQIGDSTLRTYFEPKKMVDPKGQDL